MAFAAVSADITPQISAVTASSEAVSSGQTADKAVDGVPDGWPGDYTREWATAGEAAGAWVRLDWPSLYLVNQVVLHDRPNTNDHIQSGTLLFSDGSQVSVGSLPDDGAALVVDFSSRSVNWVQFQVDSSSPSTLNVGLAEIFVFGTPDNGGSNNPPQIDSGPTAAPSSITEQETAILSVLASDPDLDPLTYDWQPALGSISGSGASVVFQPPAVASDTVVRIDLTVSDPAGLNTSGFVDVMVTDLQGSGSSDITPLISSVTASSEATSSGQTAGKAVDGVPDGWPGDYRREWSTTGEGAGAWLRLDWAEFYTVDKVVLHDRPNSNDQVLAGTLLFSDGSQVSVGRLSNDGSAVAIEFPGRSVNWVEFRVDSVSASTSNIGLAEIFVFGSLVPAGNQAPQAFDSVFDSDEDLPVDSVLSALDTEGDALIYSIVSPPSTGTVVITDVNSGAFRYIPIADSYGPDSFSFKVNDGEFDSNIATVSLTIQPVAENILVVAAHPDDETLIAAGVMKSALDAGDTVKVLVLTNGDFGGEALGYLRQGETKAVLVDRLGINEDDIIFLGYPDAGLLEIYNDYVNAGDTGYVSNAGKTESYGAQGLGRQDFHRYRTGEPSALNRANIVDDIEAVLNAYRPTRIYSHDVLDQHPDHRAVYYTLHEAMTRLMQLEPQFRPDLYSQIVHNPTDYPYIDKWAPFNGPGIVFSFPDDQNWPEPAFVGTEGNQADMEARFTPSLPLTEPPDLFRSLVSWAVRVSMPVPPVMQDTNLANNLKFQMIGEYASQHVISGLVFAFGKNEEVFWKQSRSHNIAMSASISASDENTSTFQHAINVADGIVDGYRPASETDATSVGNDSAEWSIASVGQSVGSALTLTWLSAHEVERLVLFDRPNLADQVTSAILNFSDGSSINIGPLPNDGSAYEVMLDPPRTTSSLELLVTGVSASTQLVGLAELEVYVPTPRFTNRQPFFVRGPSAVDYTLVELSSTAIAAPASDPDGDAIAYSWSSSLGATFIGVGESVTYQAPPVATVTVDTVTVTLDDGFSDPVSTQFAITVRPTGGNVATLASASCSSYAVNAFNQTCAKAIDGIADGFKEDGTGDPTKEWSSSAEGAGAFLQLDWLGSYSIDQVVLHDRPNGSDQVLSGTLLFSDGSQVAVGALPNDGSALTVDFAERLVDWVRFRVDSVRASTGSVGLAEIQVMEASASNAAPQIDAGPTALPGSITEQESANLNVVASDLDLDPLTYDWQPEQGSIIGTGANVSFQPAAVAVDTVVRINLTVSDPGGLSASGFVDVLVTDVPALPSTDITPLFFALSASSEATATGQTVAKAVDGVPDGWPGDYSREWSTSGEGAGAWLRLEWAEFYSVDKVVLHDRPNSNDQVLAGRLQFSDGSQVSVGALPNDGSALTVEFAARSVNWLEFHIDSVSASTFNVGLAEIFVFGSADVGGNSPPQIDSGPSATPGIINEQQTSALSVSASDPDSEPLSYTWLAAQGSISGSGASVTFVPPAVSSDTLVRIDLVVTDAGGLTATGFIDVLVTDVVGAPSVDITPLISSVTASAEASAWGQTADKAVNGVADGWPGDYTQEWASLGQGAGAWLRLDWPQVYQIDEVVIYDRPNSSDQVLSGTLLFGDGSRVPVGTLPNDGSPLTIAFSSRPVTWVEFQIDNVSGSTQNVGLAEISFFGKSDTQAIQLVENFDAGVATGWTVIDDSSSNGPSLWQVVGEAYVEDSGSLNLLDGIGVLGQTADGFEVGTYSYLDSFNHAAMDMRLRLRSEGIGVLGVMFGYQDGDNYYRVSFSKREGYRKLEKKVAGSFIELASSPQSYRVNEWLGLRVIMQNGSIIVYVDGDPVLSAADSTFTNGKIGVWTSRNDGSSQFDSLYVLGEPSLPHVGVSLPGEFSVQQGGILDVEAVLNDLGDIGGVEFVVDGLSQFAYSPGPMAAQFSLGSVGAEYEAVAYALDLAGERLLHSGASDRQPAIGVNGIHLVGFGDSITDGVDDDFTADDVSLDGRNTSGGYQPVLNNFLSEPLPDGLGLPITVLDEGNPGDMSIDGVGKVATVLGRNPLAQAYLVMFGTNDSNPFAAEAPDSGEGLSEGQVGYAGSYKDHMQQIIDALVATGKQVYLAKIPPVPGSGPGSDQDNNIQAINRVIDELLLENVASGLVRAGPDFYAHFTSFPGEMCTPPIGGRCFHPNGSGYASMGRLWSEVL